MNVVAFNGSCRKGGNTFSLLRHVLAELEKEGIETELVELSGKRIRGCIARYGCSANKDRRCALKDDAAHVKIAVWSKASATKGASMAIIDMHTHIWPRERHAKLIRWAKRSNPEHYADENATPESLVEDMLAFGIEAMLNLVHPFTPEETEPLHRYNASLCRKYKTVHGLASILPSNENKEDILKRAFFELGLIGLKIHPPVQKTDLSDPRMEEVWSCCETWGRPVFIHTGFGTVYDNNAGSVADIRGILERHPGLIMVICHLFFPKMEEAFHIADDFPNIYLDLTGVPISIKRIDLFADSASKCQRLLEEKLPDRKERVIMGSDHPVAGGPLDQVYGDLAALGLGEDLVTRFAYKNPSEFLERFHLLGSRN